MKLFSLILVLTSPSLLLAQGWQAGFAAESITPKQPMWMSGYAARTAPAEGKETDLFAKAAVLEAKDSLPLVLITLDLVGIDRATSQSICKPIQEKYKLGREQITINCSHTHCGPVVGSNLRTMYALDAEQGKLIDDYTTELPKLVLKAVDAAMKAKQAVTLSNAVGSCSFAVNRRENKEADVPKMRIDNQPLKGPVDHDVPVIVAKDSQGKIAGIIFGYACHATTLAFQKWCGDYPGFAMQGLEKQYPGAVALFWAGCGADQNPIPRRTLDLAKDYGAQLAKSVHAALEKPMTEVKSGVKASYAEIDLPLAPLPTREDLVKESMDKNKYLAGRAKMLLKKLENEQSLPKTYPYPVQAWRLGGEITLIPLGGEVVVDYSLRLKKDLGDVWTMGYANDVMAYIPSKRVLKEGGYEGATSMIYYGLPTVWAESVEEKIATEVARQVKALRK